MINQHRTSDILSLWVKWNTASLQWWNQVLGIWMGRCQPSDVIAQWQQWNTTNVQLWSQVLRDWTGADAYTRVLNQTMENYLHPVNAFARSTAQFQQPTVNGPSVQETMRIVEILDDLEQKMERLSVKVEQLTGEAAEGNATPGLPGSPNA